MYFFNKVLNKMTKGTKIGFLTAFLLICYCKLESQPPNYASWHFKDGNIHATKRPNSGIISQGIDSFIVKWATPFISGDVTPLIGNIISNNFPGISNSEPLEMCALMGDEILILDGSGKLLKRQKLPQFAQNVKSFTSLFDSLDTGFSDFSNNTVLIGSESIEFFNPNSKDTLAHSYIFGYDAAMDSIKVVKRLSLDLREYKPNVSASIKPFYGRKVNGRLMVYAIVDMNYPILTENPILHPFFRGYAQFYDDNSGAVFPLPDMKDQKAARIHLTGDVGLYQPSVQQLANNLYGVLLPYQAINTAIDTNFKDYSIKENVSGADYTTFTDSTYLTGFNITANGTSSNFSPVVFPSNGTRPIIRPVFAELTDANSVKKNYIVVAEQYSGIDGSEGMSRLHLYNAAGKALTGTPQSTAPPLLGGQNHYWSVAVGNVDGVVTNSWTKYFPNNHGNEIIVTQSSKESVFPESKLFVLKYNTGAAIEKPTPSGDTLYAFDTVATARVNGWLAAVADIDLNIDGKDEIFLVDGSTLMVLKMRDYADMDFRLGYPFDTLFVKEFRKQTISNVAIADMEGDGKPDIIVTTFDSTYVIGSIIPNSITAGCPSKNGVSSFCINDTITLSWKNIIISQTSVKIKFERIVNGIIKDTLIINNSADNNSDSVDYKILAGENLFNGIAGKEISGRFIIEGLDYPDKLNVTTCEIKINKPELKITSAIPDSLMVGDLLNITGDVYCGDSVTVSFSYDAGNIWQNIMTLPVVNGSFLFSSILPCIDSLFTCDQNINSLRYLDTRLIVQRNGTFDTTKIKQIILQPGKFKVTVDDKLTADPTLVIRWKSSDITSAILCDTVNISASFDNGATFSQIGFADKSSELFRWNVPYDIKDEIIIRLCCQGSSCSRSDTAITGVRPKYVEIIAPNPFNPNIEEMEFVYKIPKDMNISVSIYDQSNRLVKNILKNSPRKENIVYTERWDGTKNDGSTASNGLYYLILNLSDGSREIHQVFLGK